MINVIEDRFIFPLLSICEFCHTNSALSAVESVEELMLHLFPIINGFGLQVDVPVKSNAFEGSDAGITAHLNEIRNMLFRVPFSMKLIKLWRMISMRHTKSINPLHVRLCI